MSTVTENKGDFVAYYRVSTEQQGRSGLGLEAQKKAVLDYLNGGQWELLAEFTEIESGKKSDRPELEKALKLCRKTRATLVIAKLDRLARNVHFISGLMERGIRFCAVEFPNADPFMLHVHAAMSEHERRLISARTKAGLERAKARGVKLGRHGVILARENAAKAKAQAQELKPVVAKIRKAGKVTVRAIMEELNARGIKTLRGGTWHPQTVNVLLHRIDRNRGKAKCPPNSVGPALPRRKRRRCCHRQRPPGARVRRRLRLAKRQLRWSRDQPGVRRHHKV